MASDSGVSSMVMYEDESVYVHFLNGSELQLSPCGSEFLLVKVPAGHQPLQTREKVRQRSRFAVSAYKELIAAALEFRNRHASRPYLPHELIPDEHKMSYFSTDSDVQWPELSSCETELGPRGETIVRSENGGASLLLSPSGEEFTVEFMCRLDQTRNKRRAVECVSSDFSDSTTNDNNKNKEVQGSSSSPLLLSSSQPKPVEIYQSTIVVQHHSCCDYPPLWHYPLSLAQHHWRTRLSQTSQSSLREEGTGTSAQTDKLINLFDRSNEGRRSRLPEALALMCPAPHRHRWKSTDTLSKKAEQPEQDLPSELVRLIWCQGVTYRILSGTVAVVEISPGDASVIRSKGILSSYFTHHRPALQSGQVIEVSYHLNNLPPDVVGQNYSVSSIVNRASRILTSYNQAKLSLKLSATPSCLQPAKDVKNPVPWRPFFNPSVPEGNLSSSDTQRAENRSHLVVAELEKIRRFNFLLENSPLRRAEKIASEREEEIHEALNESSVAEALLRTSRAIQDIENVLSAARLT